VWAPESTGRRRSAAGPASAAAGGGGSMGNVVIRSETYRSSVTGLSRGVLRGKTPPPANGAVRGRAGDSYRAAVIFHTGLPPAVIVFSRASIHGLSCLGRGAYPSALGRDCPSVSAHQTNFTSAPAFAASSYCLCSRNQVKLAIGYAWSPSGFVMDTRKSVCGSIALIAPAAA